jgi:hypothetical protein
VTVKEDEVVNSRRPILTAVREEFEGWQGLLAQLSDEQITAPQLAAGWSIKDAMAHLMAWQKRSIARLEAASQEREPVFHLWPDTLDSDSEEDLEPINAWIYETYRERAWPEVYEEWRSGFLRFMELGEAIPEANLMEVGRYKWLPDYPISEVLEGSYEHHREHREETLARLGEHPAGQEPVTNY